LAFKVIEFGANRKPVYNFLLIINSNLSPISHRYCDTVVLAKNHKFCPPPLSFSALVWGDPFGIYGKASSSWSLTGTRQWKFGNSSLHRFWLIHPCDRQTDRQNCDG